MLFANYVSDEGLVSKIYKGLIQLNIQKPNSLIKKMSRRHEQTFPQRYPDGQQIHAQHHSLSDMRKRNPFALLAEFANWCSHCGKKYGGSSKNYK